VCSIARLAKHGAIQHHNCVCSDNNTIGGFGASSVGFAPSQQSGVSSQRHWAGWQRCYHGRGGWMIALFAIVGYGAKRLAEPTK
jgi:hypothetical protein